MTAFIDRLIAHHARYRRQLRPAWLGRINCCGIEVEVSYD